MGRDYHYEYEVSCRFKGAYIDFSIVVKSSSKHDTFDSGFGDQSSTVVCSGVRKLRTACAEDGKVVVANIATVTKCSGDRCVGNTTYDVMLSSDEKSIEVVPRKKGAAEPASAFASIDVPEFD